jgi:hypothetical protein
MFPINTILAWNINIIMNKKYDNNNIIIASRAYFLHPPVSIFFLPALITHRDPKPARISPPNSSDFLPHLTRHGVCKMPSSPFPVPLSRLPQKLCQVVAISRWSPQSLSPCIADSGVVGEPAPLLLLLTSFPLFGAHADALLLPNLIVNRCFGQRPKATSARAPPATPLPLH